MKLVLFNSTRLGVVTNGNVVDVTDAVQDMPHVTTQDLVNGVIAGFDSLKASWRMQHRPPRECRWKA